MKQVLHRAFVDTIPVLAGYMVLGFGFGIIMKANGFGLPLTVAMSLLIYAGSMQYVAVGLMTGGASLLATALTTLMVNARHLFYGISMLETYRGVGKSKPYLIFALTDETYSLVCDGCRELPMEQRRRYFLWVTLLNHTYWVTGSVIGAVAGSLLHFNTEGIDFALTALFLVVFLDQWKGAKNHMPAMVGLLGAILCLVAFGGEHFLIPAMGLIALSLCLLPEGRTAK